MRVSLFSTCLVDLAMPGPGRAAVDVLEAMGHEVTVPDGSSCCGQPALNSGHREPAARLVRHWIDAFAGADVVVSLGGSCAAMLAHHGPQLADRDLGVGMLEFSQFVDRHGAGLPLRLEGTATYHHSCHMTRMLGEREAPMRVLRRIEGLRIVEMVDGDVCCGFGGTFAAKLPEVSTTMADMKRQTAAETGADWVVSADPGCLTHLRTRQEADGGSLRLIHLAELVQLALPVGVQ